MRKLIAIFLISVSLTVSAQKKDTSLKTSPGVVSLPATDTVFVLSTQDVQFIQTVFRQNNISVNGKVLLFDDVWNILQELNSKMAIIPKKEEPKK
jgi:hypothetical protein